MIRNFAFSFLRVSLLVSAFAVVGWMGTQTPEVDSVPRVNAPSAVEVAMTAHNCWSGEAPKSMVGEVPGHVVVVTADGHVKVGGENMVGQALEQLFDGADNGLDIRGFCK